MWSPDFSRKFNSRSPGKGNKNSGPKIVIVSNLPANIVRTQVKNVYRKFDGCTVTTQYYGRTNDLLAYCTFESTTAVYDTKIEGHMKK